MSRPRLDPIRHCELHGSYYPKSVGCLNCSVEQTEPDASQLRFLEEAARDMESAAARVRDLNELVSAALFDALCGPPSKPELVNSAFELGVVQ